MTTPTTGSTNSQATPLSGRVALITGAAGDIGRATAVRLSSAGARVVLADLNDGIDKTAAECSSANPASDPVQVRFDVTDEQDAQRTFDQLAHDGIVADLLFNNAGYQGHFANTADYDETDFRRVLEVNVTGVFIVMKRFAQALIATGQPGAIVNTASMAHGGAPNMVAYSASKAAVIALTKTAAKDLASNSIRVNSISPAFIGPGIMWDRQVELQANTPGQYYSNDKDEVAEQMIGAVPLRRYGSLDEVAAAVQFLLSDDASYITAFDVEVSGGAV